MGLPNKSSYDDLNGSECAKVLAARFWQFLETVPEFQQRFALTRVKMRLEVSMDIWGASPPRKIVHDSLELEMTGPIPSTFDPTAVHHEAVHEVDAFNNPPDLIREEHSLPLPRAARGQAGFMETVPTILEGMEAAAKYPPAPTKEQLPLPPPPATLASPMATDKIFGIKQRRPYAAVVELDRGSLQRGDRDNGPVIGGDKFASTIMDSPRGDVVMPQPDFLAADYRGPANAEHIQQRVEQSAKAISEANREFLQAKDTGAVEWDSPGGGGNGGGKG